MRQLLEGGAYLKIVPDEFTFSIIIIFIQWYTFYLLIFLWTDTKLIRSFEKRKALLNWLYKSQADICFLQDTYSTPGPGCSKAD